MLKLAHEVEENLFLSPKHLPLSTLSFRSVCVCSGDRCARDRFRGFLKGGGVIWLILQVWMLSRIDVSVNRPASCCSVGFRSDGTVRV